MATSTPLKWDSRTTFPLRAIRPAMRLGWSTAMGRWPLAATIRRTRATGVSGPMGFYAHPKDRTPILDIRVAADLPQAQRPNIEILRTDSPAFQRLLEAVRNRHDAFYVTPPGKVDICAVPAPVRDLSKP